MKPHSPTQAAMLAKAPEPEEPPLSVEFLQNKLNAHLVKRLRAAPSDPIEFGMPLEFRDHRTEENMAMVDEFLLSLEDAGWDVRWNNPRDFCIVLTPAKKEVATA